MSHFRTVALYAEDADEMTTAVSRLLAPLEETLDVAQRRPQATWDWYQIGGRFSHHLPVRVGADPTDLFAGERSWANENERLDPTYTDAARVRALDFERARAAAPLLYPQACDCLWAPEPEAIRTIDEQNRLEREREQRRQQDARAWVEIDAAIGPRRPSCRYWDCYWHRWYTVEAIFTARHPTDYPAWWIGVRWDDGTRSTHSTPWNPQGGDAQPPPGSAPEPPQRRHWHAVCRRCTSRFALVRAAHRLGLL